MKAVFKGAAIAASVSVLVACGGGGDDGGDSNQPIPTNSAPDAVAGPIQNILVGATVTLDGSASTDQDGDALTYRWTLTSKPTGSTAALSNATSVNPTFIADIAGTYTISLIVSDGQLSSRSVATSINASEGAPLALTGIEISPANYKLQYGSSQRIPVYASYSDGSKVEISDGLEWRSETAACSFSDLNLNWTPYSINTTVAYNPSAEYQYYKDIFTGQRNLAREGDSQALDALRSVAIDFLKRSRTLYASSPFWTQDLELVIGALDEASAPRLYSIDNTVANSCALGRWRQFVFELGIDNMVPSNAYQVGMVEYQKLLSEARIGSIEGAWRFFGVAEKMNALVGVIGGATQLQFVSNLAPDVQDVINYKRAPSSVVVDVDDNQMRAVMLDNARVSVRYDGFSSEILINVTK